MHLNVGKEFLPGILQAGPEEIDYIIDNEESVVIMLGGTDINRWVLLIVTSDVKLLLLVLLCELVPKWNLLILSLIRHIHKYFGDASLWLVFLYQIILPFEPDSTIRFLHPFSLPA